MKQLLITAILIALAACGQEAATTAATSAAIKQREIEEGKKTMQRSAEKVGQAMEQAQQRADKDGEK
jgi:maltose-binding protein MalE